MKPHYTIKEQDTMTTIPADSCRQTPSAMRTQ